MLPSGLHLNQRSLQLCQNLQNQCEELRIARHAVESGTTVYDFGIEVLGSVEAGELLARVCLADLATVELIDPDPTIGQWPRIAVTTDQPIAACLASQYAGWEIKHEGYFAMGSGPMRAAAAREPLFEDIGYRESTNVCVGVLEASQLPPDEVCVDLAKKCDVHPKNLTLLVAPTNSMAGTLQVVARSVEAVLHKLHELGFDLSRVKHGRGTAPLPPVADDALAAIGVTNDAILYGGQVELHVTGGDESLVQIGPQLPSSASSSYGQPFVKILADHNHDFYRVDSLLFSATEITLINLDTDNLFRFGKVKPQLLQESFGNL